MSGERRFLVTSESEAGRLSCGGWRAIAQLAPFSFERKNGTMSSSDPFADDGIDWSAFDPDAAVASARGGGTAVASAPASSSGTKHGVPSGGAQNQLPQPTNAKKARVTAAAAITLAATGLGNRA